MSDLSDPTALPDEFADLRAKLAVATPGAWNADSDPNDFGGEAGYALWGDTAIITGTWYEDNGLYGGAGITLLNKADAEFVAAAHNQLPALFAELDGLRAQIEEIRKVTSDYKLADGEPSESADFGEGLERGASIKSQHIRRILAQSPRGTVARIQTETLEAFADKLGKTAFARDEVVGLLCDEADALREGAGQ